MRLLTLAIEGTPVQLPGQVQDAYNKSGAFGTNIIQLGVNVMLFVAILLLFVYILWGGFKWLTSQGDKKAVEEAKNTIIWAVVGVILVALSFLIVNLILGFFNVPLLTK